MASDLRVGRWTVAALLAGAAIIALLAGWAGARLATGTPLGMAPAAVSGSRGAEPLDRLAALEARVERMAVQMDRLAGTAPSGRARPALAGAPTESPASDAEQVQAQRQRVQALAAEFDAERIDPRWSAATEAALQRIGSSDAILSIEARPPERQVVDCRRTRCRMEFDFADRADAEDWTLAYLTSLGGTLPRSQYFVSSAPGGRTRITLYGQR